jgi:hypothetical protein
VADYEAASRTKDFHKEQLLRDYPEIVLLSPRIALDTEGMPTGEAVIVVGVPPQFLSRVRTALQSQLQAVDTTGTLLSAESIPVVFEPVAEIYPQMNTNPILPCPGGFSIGHPNITAGTLGGVVEVNGKWGYILSNNHVLAATNNANVGDPILQPGPADGGGPTIATLDRWVPIDFRAGAINEVDAAYALANSPWQNNVDRNVFSIGTPNKIAAATVGQAVRKSGRTTQFTTGIVISTNATIAVNYGPGQMARFDGQIELSNMSAGGDSGSLLFDGSSLTVVGLIFAGNGINSYANPINRVLTLLSQALTFYKLDGSKTSFDSVDVQLT